MATVSLTTKAETTLNLAEGQTVELRYKARMIVFLPGKLEQV